MGDFANHHMSAQTNAQRRIADALERIADVLEQGSVQQGARPKSIGKVFAKADECILEFVSGEKATEARQLMQQIQKTLQSKHGLQPNFATDISKVYTKRAFAEWARDQIEVDILNSSLFSLEHNESSLTAAWCIADALEKAGMWDE
tara:strand:- start:596 stop:1036 length:441 start_codon:yes stop_codon:yes gene_type:complete